MFGIDEPDILLRPWANLKQFSEELYAAFRRGGTQSQQPAGQQRPDSSKPGEPSPIKSLPDYEQPQQPLRARPLPDSNYAQQQVANSQVTAPDRSAPPRPFADPLGFPSGIPETPLVMPAPAVQTPSSQLSPQDQADSPRRTSPVPTGIPPLDMPITPADTPSVRPEPTTTPLPSVESPPEPSLVPQAAPTRLPLDDPTAAGPSRPTPAPISAGVPSLAAPRPLPRVTKPSGGEDPAATGPQRPAAPYKPKRPEDPSKRWPTSPNAQPQGAYPLGGGAGTSVFMGQVISFTSGGSNADSSSSVVVQLYSNGPNGSPDTSGPNGEEDGQITVGLLLFLGTDFIPSGYWVSGIIQSDDGNSYWANVPVWS